MPVELTQVISVISIILALLAWRSNARKDDKKDAGELTTVIVKLENIQNDVKEMKADMKADLKEVRDGMDDIKQRLTVVEQSTKSAHHRIDQMQKGDEE